jgi:hypothetical protein
VSETQPNDAENSERPTKTDASSVTGKMLAFKRGRERKPKRAG